jgi:hypothetical protein
MWSILFINIGVEIFNIILEQKETGAWEASAAFSNRTTELSSASWPPQMDAD